MQRTAKIFWKRLLLFWTLSVLPFFVPCQAAEWKAECNGNTTATCESRKIASNATEEPIRFVKGFFPGTKAAEFTRTTGLSWPLTEADFNVNKGTASFWFKPIGWGNGKKNEEKSSFIPVWAIDSKGGFNWAHIAFVSWSGTRLRLQMQTHGKKGANSIYFLSNLPEKSFLPDQWSLLTFTWSNNDISAYINGERIGTTDYGLPFEKPFDSHWNFYAFPRLFWKQDKLPPVHVCNIKMEDRVLSMQEIRQEYLNGLAAQKTLSSAEAAVPLAAVPVKVDGTVSEKEWQDATSFPVGIMFGNGIYNSDSAGRLYLKHDGKQLYAALSVAEAKTRVSGTPGKMGTACYENAVCDFWWGHGNKHCQIGVAPNGAYGYRDEQGKWQDIDFSKAGKITQDGWSVEFAVPLKHLQVKPGETLDANFCFQRPTVEHFDNRWLVWNLIRTRQPMFLNFGKLHFLQTATPVRVDGLTEANYGKIKVQVNAGTANTVKVNGSFPLKQQGDCWTGTLSAGNGTLRTQVLHGEAVQFNQDVKISVVDPVVFSTICHAAARIIDCNLDWRGLVERCRNKKVTGTFTITSEADGKVYGKIEAELKDGKSLIKLPFSELPVGRYTICAEISCGKDHWTRKDQLNRPDETFLHDHRGLDHTIPPPFKPLKTTELSTEAANLSYTFSAKMPFPKQITAGGEPVLASPLDLELVVAGKVQQLTPTAFRITENAPDRQIAEGEVTTGSKQVKIRWKRITAYDGMLKYHIEVIPNGKVTIDRFRVRGIVGSEYCRYCLAPNFQAEWTKQGKCFAFPYLHLSGINAGVTLFTDNDANWVFGKEEPLRALRLNDGNGEVSANFICSPVSSSRPFTYVLGVMGTPSKKVRNDWRTIHDAGWGRLKGQNLQILFGCTPPMKFMRMQELSMPIDKNIQGWFKEMKSRRGNVTRLVPYIFGDGFSSKTPPAEYYGADWRRTVGGVTPPISDEAVDVDGTPFALLGITACFNHQGPADYLCYHFDQLLQKYPFCGLYIDGGGASLSDTPYPGTDITPVLQPNQRVRNYNIFGKRDLLERFFRIIKKRCGESGVMFVHNWDNYPPCLVSFSDLLYPGEEFMHSIRSGLHVYVEGTPLEKWQSNYNSRLHGAGVQFLGQWNRTIGDLIRLPAGQRWEYTKPVLMMCLLHDVPLSGTWYPAIEDTWALLDTKKVCDAEFIGYWMPGGWKCSNDKLRLSRYQWRNSSAQLLIIGNLSRNPQQLTELPGKFTLVDAYTQKPVSFPVSVDGNFGFRILQAVPAGK